MAPSTVGAWLGGVAPTSLTAIGASLLPFALSLVWQATRREPRLALALATVVADGLWVAGSAVVVGVAPLSGLGTGIVAGVAAIVAALAAAQFSGIRRAVSAPDAVLGTDCHYRVSTDLALAPRDLWPVVADLGGIAAHAPQLQSSEVEGAEVGAVRRCRSTRGDTWREEVTAWKEGEGFDMRFGTDEPRFPFPMAPMYGGWRVEQLAPGRTRVTVWWSFSTKPRWASPIIVALMDAGARRDMRAIIQSMGASIEGPKVVEGRSLA